MANELVQYSREVNDENFVKAMLNDLIQKTKEQQSSLIYQIDLERTKRDILLSAGGYHFDAKENKILVRETPTLNAKGVIKLNELLSTYLTKDTVLSITTNREIQNMMLTLAGELHIMMTLKRKDFELDYNSYPERLNSWLEAIFLCLKRSHNGETLKHIETIQRFIEQLKDQTKGEDDKISNLFLRKGG